MPAIEPFVVSSASRCSFCDTERTAGRTLVGLSSRRAAICDQCLGLGWELIADEIEQYQPPVRFDVDAKTVREQIDATAQELATARGGRAATERSLELRRAAQALMPTMCCSFCDAYRAEVLKLVCGPRVLVCDECIESATSALVAVRA